MSQIFYFFFTEATTKHECWEVNKNLKMNFEILLREVLIRLVLKLPIHV